MTRSKQVSEPLYVLLSAIRYRVQIADKWTVVFTEDGGISGRPARFIIHRDDVSLWKFSNEDGWGDPPCSHIVQAYEWCKVQIGDDFDMEPREPHKQVKHQWRFNETLKRSFCQECGVVRDKLTRLSDCGGMEPSPLEIAEATIEIFAAQR